MLLQLDGIPHHLLFSIPQILSSSLNTILVHLEQHGYPCSKYLDEQDDSSLFELSIIPHQLPSSTPHLPSLSVFIT